MIAIRRAAVAACIGLALTLPWNAASAQGLATAIKAAYLVKFGGFVEWPPSAFASPTSPLLLCIVGADPFDGMLDRAAAGQFAGGHPVEIRRLPAAARNSGCNIAYAAAAAADGVLAAMQGEAVLTVTDVPPGAPRKGIINFLIDSERVRFEIDRSAAAQAGLRVSSQLIALAVNANP